MTNTAFDNRTIRLDRMRYNKNLFSSRICYLAILFNVFYFVIVYEINNNQFYQMLMGLSIVYNLLFLLLCFLSSEGVKNYKKSYGYLLLGLGVGQIVRIFILPAQMARVTSVIEYVNERQGRKMVKVAKEVIVPAALQPTEHMMTIVFLCLSAACCLVAGAVAVIRSHKLHAYNASLTENTK